MGPLGRACCRWSSISPAPSLPHAGGGRLQDCLPVCCQIEMNVSSRLPAGDSNASTLPAPTAASARRALPWAPEDNVKVKLVAPSSPAPPTHLCRAEQLLFSPLHVSS